MSRNQGNIAGVEDPAELLTEKGALIGASAPGVPVEIPPGPDGEALIYDSTAVGGVSSRAFDPASTNIVNAANAALFKLGM